MAARAVRRWRDLDAVWVRFPAAFHTYGPVQGFYFDVEGLPVAQHRRVYGRFGRGPWSFRAPLLVLSADLACG